MTPAEFEQLVADIGFSPVPEKFRRLISNVALTIEDEPTLEMRRQMALPENETLLGLYHGIPRTARGDSYGIGGGLPDKITLYRLPIIRAARQDGVPIRTVLEETIWHEVAHHFGLDDDEVAKRESQRSAESKRLAEGEGNMLK